MTRRFWMQMTYGCKCGFEVPMLLEEGCEGPRGDGGWVPVPFVVGPCPNHQPGETIEGRYGPVRPVLTHIRWGEDVEFDEPVILDDVTAVPHFRRPTRAERRKWGDWACGVPVLVGLDREELR